ncbi:MAG: adenylate/guanylate cyclase domain-containing protein [Bacteroidetes bacterium]|nr:adenylate/guanylate cyclase domain-containing protein [Bacteroidota bacterium]
MLPETKYTKSGDISIAYQVIGNGSMDLVLVPGWVSNIEIFWEDPSMVRFLKKLASFSRLILFDKRGTGLSDRATDSPTLEERMDDVRAVMDAVDSKRASLLGYSEGGSMVALFAATYPDRTTSIIMIGSFARRTKTTDFPIGVEPISYQNFIETIESEWGGPVGLETRAPSMVNDDQFKNWWARLLRMGATPATALAIIRMNAEIDIRNILTSIKVPALILHADEDPLIDVAQGVFLANHIPNSKLVTYRSEDHLPWVGGGSGIVLGEIEEFITGIRTKVDIDRVLSTLMFTDIVDSTRIASELGDQKWGDLLQSHYSAIRHELSVYRGREIDTAGDGFFAAFDGPARALHCARAIRDSIKKLRLSLRIGMHTGECEVLGDDVVGIAVHIAARISSLAEPDQILVSRTVKDLVAGSGIEFEDFGAHRLKGVSEEWNIFVVK